MFTPQEIAIMTLITAATAFPAAMIAFWLSMRLMLRQQMKQLPKLLSDSHNRFLLKETMTEVLNISGEEMAATMMAQFNDNLEAMIQDRLRNIMADLLTDMGNQLLQSMKGTLGAYTKNLSKHLMGDTDPNDPRHGGKIGQLMNMVKTFQQVPNQSQPGPDFDPSSMYK